MPAPLFSIITISYNQEQWVRQAIESVLASSFTDFEYIIADDGSTDKTWDVIEQYHDARIKKYRNQPNIGEYANRNKALSIATGKYVLYVDGDDILYKNTLRNLAEVITSFPAAGMIWGVPDVYFHFAVLPYEFSSEQLLNLLYRTRIPVGVTGLSETVFKTDVLKQVGGFSTEYGIGDYYIKVRLSLITSAVFVPRGLAFWRQNHNQATARVSKNYKSFLDRHHIDNNLIPLLEEKWNGQSGAIVKNIQIRNIKLLVGTTLMKGKIIDFFKLYKLLNTRPADFKLLFEKGDYSYQPSEAVDRPLINSFNFQ